MFSIRTSFSGLRKIELVDCPSVKEWIKHDPSCDSRKWEIVCCIIVTLVMIWQWADYGHNPAPGHTSVHSAQMMQYCDNMWHGQATVKIIREMVTLAMLLRWRQWSVAGVFVTLIHHHQCDTCHRCAAPVTPWWPETWGLTPLCNIVIPRVIREKPADKLGHCSTHDPTTKLARGEENMRAERLFTLCRN